MDQTQVVSYRETAVPDTQMSAKRAIVVSAKEAESGSWYYGFNCSQCSAQIAVFDDKSNGEKAPSMGGSGHLQVACPTCTADATYESSEIVQFQAG